MPINPKILQKVDTLDVPEKLKQIIIDALEAEDELEASGTQKQFLKTYDRLLDKFAKDSELIKFSEEYDK